MRMCLLKMLCSGARLLRLPTTRVRRILLRAAAGINGSSHSGRQQCREQSARDADASGCKSLESVVSTNATIHRYVVVCAHHQNHTTVKPPRPLSISLAQPGPPQPQTAPPIFFFPLHTCLRVCLPCRAASPRCGRGCTASKRSGGATTRTRGVGHTPGRRPQALGSLLLAGVAMLH